MAGDGSVQAHLDLSQEFLSSASRSLSAGELAPDRFMCVHALELAVKAALAAALGHVPRTHNVGGEFGKHFREKVGSDAARRINRILSDYDGPRYPDWEPPEAAELASDLEFVRDVVTVLVPRLVEGNR